MINTKKCIVKIHQKCGASLASVNFKQVKKRVVSVFSYHFLHIECVKVNITPYNIMQRLKYDGFIHSISSLSVEWLKENARIHFSHCFCDWQANWYNFIHVTSSEILAERMRVTWSEFGGSLWMGWSMRILIDALIPWNLAIRYAKDCHYRENTVSPCSKTDPSINVI